MRLGKTAQDEHRQHRVASTDRGQRIDAAVAGHRDVQQQHVDAAGAHDLQRLAAVGGLGDDLEVRLLGEELAQPGANHGVVVDDGDADHVRRVLLGSA